VVDVAERKACGSARLVRMVPKKLEIWEKGSNRIAKEKYFAIKF
jgi:hypothetical protein